MPNAGARRAGLVLSRLVLAGLILTGPGAASGAESAADAEALARGAYVFRAAGCAGCHTDPKRKHEPLAGGPALETPFGTFYGPNISPDPEHGIGRWRAGDVTYYLKTGFRPDGDVADGAMSGVIEEATAHLSDADRAAIAAYLSSLTPIPRR